jgi:hypothetical protein
MLTYDFQMGLECGEAIRTGFAGHGIYAPEDLNVNMVAIDLTAQDSLFMLGQNQVETARTVDFDFDKSDPLYSCIIELANAHQPRQFVTDNLEDLQKAIGAAKHSLMVIRDHDRVASGPTAGRVHEKEFSVIDGRLVRNYFSCWFHQH